MNPLTDPFGALLRLQRTLESNRDTGWPGAGGTGSFPPVNVFAQDGSYVLVAEVPGVHKEELVVEATGNRLRIAGIKRPLYGDDVSVHRQERAAGPFDRTITLPIDIDADGIQAEYRDGILAVSMPPAPHERPRTIRVS